MAGAGSSLARILEKAEKGPAKKRAAEGSSSPSPQVPVTTPQAAAEAGSEGIRPKTKKKRAKSDGTEVRAVVVPAGGTDLSKQSDCGKESMPPPSWLEHLTKAAYGDPLQACKEICDHASGKLRHYPVLVKEKEKADDRVKELERALELATEKIKSSDKELQIAKQDLRVAREDLQLAGEKIGSLEEKNSKLYDDVRELSTERASWQEEKEGLEEELGLMTQDAARGVEESFKNALQQVELCYPEVSIDENIVHYRHMVIGDQIVLPRGRSDGTSLVIYRGPSNP